MINETTPSLQHHKVNHLPLQHHDRDHEVEPHIAYEDMEDPENEETTSQRKHAIFMRAFAGNLKAEGLRSPQYYHDKSQCLSFHESASPAEMGYLKARSLKYGYVEPEELIDRLRKLKPTGNFTLRKYRHRLMEWGKSPIIEIPQVSSPPDSEWFLVQVSGIVSTRRQIGYDASEIYRLEAQDHWNKLRNVERIPLPDLHLLKDMGRSPSGTLFPRYLVKGLHELRETADRKGRKYYIEEYEKAKDERKELIHQWRKRNPNSVLADDPLSIYRTWPLELMDQLDTADKRAIQRSWARYMADLRETEKQMQVLVTFWRNCGLVTGQRTPPSPPWPDPKAKLRGLLRPQYVKDRLEALSMEYQRHKDWNEYKKNRFIELTRWKEAVLNASSEPSASDTPFPQSLMDELGLVWQGYDNFEPEETEDEMIMKIAQWRKSKCSNSHQSCPQAKSSNGSIETTSGKAGSRNSAGCFFGLSDIPSENSPLPSRELKQDIEPMAQKSIWWGRLRSRKEASKPTTSPMQKRQAVVKRRGKRPSRRSQPTATKDHIDRPKGLKFVSEDATTQNRVDSIALNAMPLSSKPYRRSERLQRLPNISSTVPPEGTPKTRRSRRNRDKASRQGGDTQS